MIEKKGQESFELMDHIIWILKYNDDDSPSFMAMASCREAWTKRDGVEQ